MNRFWRRVIEDVMNFPLTKVLTWCLPLAMLLTAIVLIMLFGRESIVSSILYALFGSGGYVAGSMSK